MPIASLWSCRRRCLDRRRRSPLSRKRLPAGAGADLCRSRRSRARRAGRRPCPGRAGRRALERRGAPASAPGTARFYVEADVVALIRGAGGTAGAGQLSRRPAATTRAAGRRGSARGSEYLLLARAGAGPARRAAAGRARRAARRSPPSAPRPAARDPRARRARADAPPRITGIGRAFHVPGSLPGESETQIFLQTADNRPISLNVLRRPGRAAALVGRAERDRRRRRGAAARRDTLLWYRLACTLPPRAAARRA